MLLPERTTSQERSGKDQICAQSRPKSDRIYIFCNWPNDWSCRSDLFHVLAQTLSSKKYVFTFSKRCLHLDLRPRVFFVGGLTDLEDAQQHKFYLNSDLKVLFNFEPSKIPQRYLSGTPPEFDLAFTNHIQPGFERSRTLFFRWPYASFAFAQSLTLDLNQLERRLAPLFPPTKFAAYATRHCRAAHRTQFYSYIAQRIQPLTYLNERCSDQDVHPGEIGMLEDRGDEQKFMQNVIAHYSKFKFAVVFENHLIDGYVTEKLMLARLSGAIPVYYGGQLARILFNPHAFIDCSPTPPEISLNVSYRRCIQQVESVHRSDDKWKTMFESAFLNEYNHTIAMDTLSKILISQLELRGAITLSQSPQVLMSALCDLLSTQTWIGVPHQLEEFCIK